MTYLTTPVDHTVSHLNRCSMCPPVFCTTAKVHEDVDATRRCFCNVGCRSRRFRTPAANLCEAVTCVNLA